MAGGFKKIDEYNKSLTPEQRKANASRAGRMPRNSAGVKNTLNRLRTMLLDNSKKGNPDTAKNIKEFSKRALSLDQEIATMIAIKARQGQKDYVKLYLQLTGELTEKHDINLTGGLPIIITGEDSLED